MEDKILDLIERMYTDLKGEIRNVGNQVAKLENDLKPKVEALFDGYKQHTDILERIEKQVTRQDELIMRRIK